MYNAIFREFLTFMMEDPRNITPCMHLHFIAKNTERMGDLVLPSPNRSSISSLAKAGPAAPQGDRTSTDPAISRQVPEPDPEAAMMSTEQPTVLLVEDEPAQREVLGYNLEADGFRVLTGR